MPDSIDDRLVPCPAVEVFLDSREDLYLLPIRDRDQLCIGAPWGRRVMDALSGAIHDDLPAEDDAELARILDWLEAESYVRRARALASADTEPWSRQVQWFAQETGDGPARQRQLASASILVIGVGGLGSVVADLLARAGVGQLTLVDDDVVEHANLARQSLYVVDDVGHPKVDIARERLRAAMPTVRIDAIMASVDGSGDAAALMQSHLPDLVVCAADRPPVAIKTWIESAAVEAGVPVMHGGHRPPYVYAGPFFVPGMSPCYECFSSARFAPGAERLEREIAAHRNAQCPQLPAVGWGDSAAASLMTAQVVNWLTGAAPPALLGRELELDLRSLATEFIDAPNVGRCDRCAREHARAA